jgi:hypothetical protein
MTAPDGYDLGTSRTSTRNPFKLPANMMDVVVLRRDVGDDGVCLQSTAGSFSGAGQSAGLSHAGLSHDSSGMVNYLREGPLVSIGLRSESRLQAPAHRLSVPGPGSDLTALKNKLAHSRQMLQEARRRIQVLEQTRQNDAERAQREIHLQVESVRAEAMVEIRKLKERAKMHESTRSTGYMPMGGYIPPTPGSTPGESPGTPGTRREDTSAASARELVSNDQAVPPAAAPAVPLSGLCSFAHRRSSKSRCSGCRPRLSATKTSSPKS